jgi:hypothetical protein
MLDLKEWLEKENKLLKSRRRYLHFDRRVNPSRIIHLICNPTFIIQRSFWPFIESTITFPRYKKDIESGLRKIDLKSRKICYASHCDSAIYSYYNFVLGDKFEHKILQNDLTKNILAYRRLGKKCNIHFASEVFERIKEYDEVVALTFDIEKFFDSLDHKILFENWKAILNCDYLPEDHFAIFKSLTKFASVKRDDLNKLFNFKNILKNKSGRLCSSKDFRDKVRKQGFIIKNTTEKGIPQGSPMSGLLSNIYMFEFDKIIQSKMKTINGAYRRYSDDLIILCPINFVSEIERFIVESIKSITKLEINPSKTTKTFFKKNEYGVFQCLSENGSSTHLQYLGFDFNGNSILVRSSSLSRYYRKMARRVKKVTIQKRLSKSDKTKVFKKKLFSLYSHLGKRNFISYAFRASEITDSEAIKKQVSRHWNKLNRKIKELDN